MTVLKNPITGLSLILCFLSVSELSGQQKSSMISDSIPSYMSLKQSLIISNFQFDATKQRRVSYNDIYMKSLGLFCKFEKESAKHTPLPIYMRLGSLEYVDRLESKIPLYESVQPFAERQ